MIRVMMMLTYISPLLDLDFGDMLDGDLQPVPVPHPRVHDTKTTLPENRTNLKHTKMGEGKAW